MFQEVEQDSLLVRMVVKTAFLYFQKLFLFGCFVCVYVCVCVCACMCANARFLVGHRNQKAQSLCMIETSE